jgi:DNA-binding CsgD family transcriptional regulator
MATTATPVELVGRDEEFAQIEALLDRGAERSVALALEGEAGIGKTTLWQAGVDLARQRGHLVLTARPAESERELSFSALGDLLEPVLEKLEALPEPRGRALRVALLLAEDDRLAPGARAVGVATLDLLRLLARERLLLVAVDDTQWLDPPSRETLEYALRRLDAEHVAFLGARRLGGDDRPLGEGCERLVVSPLSMAALHELVRAKATATMSRPTLVRLHETSGGNPFFALELAHALAGRELRPGDPLPVPATLAGLTAARFEGLDAGVRKMLLYVAALARPTQALVAEAIGGEVSPALDAAAAERVVEVDGVRIRFTHPLPASAHYGAASEEELRSVHRRLAQVVQDPEERARHLGAATEDPDEEVAATLETAATAARARGAPAAAAELADRALRLTPTPDSAAIRRRMLAAADHHFVAGSTGRARSMLEQALADAPRGPERARVALQLASLLDTQDRVAARALLTKALREADGDPKLEIEIHQMIAYTHANSDWPKALLHARTSAELARDLGDPELLASTVALAVYFAFRCGEGIDHAAMRRAVTLEQRLSRVPLEIRPSADYAFMLKWAGDIDRARPIYARLRALGRADDDSGLAVILFYSAAHELISEDWEQAANYAEESHGLAVQTERRISVAHALFIRAVISAYRGLEVPARVDAAEAARLAIDAGLPGAVIGGWPIGVLELTFGNHDAALQSLRPATEESLSVGVVEPGLWFGFPEHVEAAIAAGELAEARDLLALVEARAQGLDRAWALACCARGRALLAVAERDDAAADDAFSKAYVHHSRRPQQLRQQKREAIETLERAREIFARLGAVGYEERARSELARVGGRAMAAGGELTETERRIADLVAQGRSNKEVAAALSLSPKTVEWNLSKVYAKLGVRSRAELAGRHR